MGKRYAIKYGTLKPVIEKVAGKSYGNDDEQVETVNLPYDKEIDSLYTIVEDFGNGLWQDTITGFIYGSKVIGHLETKMSEDDIETWLILGHHNYSYDGVARNYYDYDFENITSYIMFCTLKTRSMVDKVQKKLREKENIVKEAFNLYQSRLSDGENLEGKNSEVSQEIRRLTELRNQLESKQILDEPIFIRKEAGKKKDAVRISKEEDIPSALKGAVRIEDGELVLDCTEGEERAPLGSVIGYEASDKTASGMNTWNIANAATNLVEKDGVFFTKPTVFEAQRIGDELPSFMEGAQVVMNADGSYTVTTDWGQSTGFKGEAYFVRYGTKADGTPDVNILTKSEESYEAYFVCDKAGNIIGKLSEIDPVIKDENKVK